MPQKNSSPKRLFRFDRHAFVICVVFFAIEVLIAVFFRDPFVRYFLGDVFVVVLIGYFVRSFTAVRFPIIAIATFLFACGVEIAQYFNVADLLGGCDNLLVQLTIGSTFDWKDIFAYAIGAILILLIARLPRNCAQ